MRYRIANTLSLVLCIQIGNIGLLAQTLGDAFLDASRLAPPMMPVGAVPQVTPGIRANTPGDDVVITFVEKVWETVNQMGPNGKAVDFKVEKHITRQESLPLDTNLDEIDLPPDGKRLAVLTITAKRHEKLLQALMDAKSDEEKTAATEALQTNYSEHYAIETWWRQQKLEELETQLKELREQVQQRVDSQEKYVSAAMTLAGLHAQGIAIAPPKPAPPVQAGYYTPALGDMPADRLGSPAGLSSAADSFNPYGQSWVGPSPGTYPANRSSSPAQLPGLPGPSTQPNRSAN